MKRFTHRAGVVGLLAGSAALVTVLATTSAQAAQNYSVTVTAPQGFNCLTWQWGGDGYRGGEIGAQNHNGTAEMHLSLQADPGQVVYLYAYSGNGTTADGGACIGGEIQYVGQATVTTPQTGTSVNAQLG